MTAACHELEEGSLSRGGGYGQDAVLLLKGEYVFGVHDIGIYREGDLCAMGKRVRSI